MIYLRVGGKEENQSGGPTMPNPTPSARLCGTGTYDGNLTRVIAEHEHRLSLKLREESWLSG